uniref:Uncharacterized protein n=1 Tax=Setaria viridis TaxID=4556 RepID=A0A4U6W9Q0_SETVI|nr:hypothetical protein SEVIR_1G060700v2 [Setaria viridis]
MGIGGTPGGPRGASRRGHAESRGLIRAAAKVQPKPYKPRDARGFVDGPFSVVLFGLAHLSIFCLLGWSLRHMERKNGSFAGSKRRCGDPRPLANTGQPQRAASRVRGGSRRPGQRRVRVAVVLGDRRVRGLRGRGPSGMRQSWEAALWAALMPARSCSRTCSQRGSREKAEHGGGRGACTGTAAAFAPVAPPPPHRPTMLSRVRRRAEAP